MLLNTFPTLLSFGILAPLILRLVLGFIAIDLGYLKLYKENQEWRSLFEVIHFHPSALFVKLMAWIEMIGGVLLLFGIISQLVAIVFSVIFFCEMIIEYREESLENRNLPFYILIFAISLSLVFTGAGAFALDLTL